MFKLTIFILFFGLTIFCRAGEIKNTVVVGSKKFTENFILAELISQLLENQGFKVNRRFGMDSTIAFEALKQRAIDIYPEYTGTVSHVYLKNSSLKNLNEINTELSFINLEILEPFGFDNSYSIAMLEEKAKSLGITKIEDLRKYELQGVFSFEFAKRIDGWPELKKIYNLSFPFKSMEHALTYEALKNKEADFTDVYSTDAKVKKFKLLVLDDNLGFFPKYKAVPIVHKEIPELIKKTLNQLSNKIDNETMKKLNFQAEYMGKSFEQIARDFLTSNGILLISEKNDHFKGRALQLAPKIWRQTLRHLYLTFIAIIMAIFFAIPIGTLLFIHKKIAPTVLLIAGLIQTIPSIALLAFMIPFFGIGTKPAVIALFLFSILPILRNTYTALDNIDKRLMEAARGIGLRAWEIMLFVQLPLATPVIIAGVRTAATISVGTATLAAFVGAGGLGEPIVAGLALNNHQLILQGAIPAAFLAICLELIFDQIQKKVEEKTL